MPRDVTSGPARRLGRLRGLQGQGSRRRAGRCSCCPRRPPGGAPAPAPLPARDGPGRERALRASRRARSRFPARARVFRRRGLRKRRRLRGGAERDPQVAGANAGAGPGSWGRGPGPGGGQPGGGPTWGAGPGSWGAGLGPGSWGRGRAGCGSPQSCLPQDGDAEAPLPPGCDYAGGCGAGEAQVSARAQLRALLAHSSPLPLPALLPRCLLLRTLTKPAWPPPACLSRRCICNEGRAWDRKENWKLISFIRSHLRGVVTGSLASWPPRNCIPTRRFSARVPEFTCQVAGCCQRLTPWRTTSTTTSTLHGNVCSYCAGLLRSPAGHPHPGVARPLFQILAERQDMVSDAAP